MLWMLFSIPIFWSIFSDCLDDGHPIVGLFFGVFGGLLGGFFITFFLGLFMGIFFAEQWVEDNKQELVAIRDKDGMRGSFFLGSGTIDSVNYYFYYQRNSDGSFSPARVKANGGIKIFEEPRSDAVLVTYRSEFKTGWAALVAIPFGSRHEFMVPAGTIRRGFTM